MERNFPAAVGEEPCAQVYKRKDPSENPASNFSKYRQKHAIPPAVVEPIPASFLKVRQIVEPLNGASCPHLVTCSDGCMYVLKTRDNPQGLRTLANELIAYGCAGVLELPRVPCAFIDVDWLMTEVMRNGQVEGRKLGLSFGSKYLSPFFAPAVETARVNNRLRDSVVACISNKRDFLGILVFDIWTLNTDNRQVICHWQVQGRLRAYLIDNGCCFCRGRWDLPSLHYNHLFESPLVYKGVTKIEDFEPWLNILEQRVNGKLLEEIAGLVPKEWSGGGDGDLDTLVGRLDQRRLLVRGILENEYLAAGRFQCGAV